jgi:hypothetical protein
LPRDAGHFYFSTIAALTALAGEALTTCEFSCDALCNLLRDSLMLVMVFRKTAYLMFDDGTALDLHSRSPQAKRLIISTNRMRYSNERKNQ